MKMPSLPPRVKARPKLLVPHNSGTADLVEGTGVTERHLFALRAEGVLEGAAIGKSIVYSDESVSSWLASRGAEAVFVSRETLK